MKHDEVVVSAGMLIRKPVDVVFNAFIDPEITSKFWFTKSNGRLDEGRQLRWEWEMYGAAADVYPGKIEKNELIVFEWGNPKSTVEISFSAFKEKGTYVEVKSYGYPQSGKEMINAIIDNTGGFTTMLDNMKAWLEYNLSLNLVADKFPFALKKEYEPEYRSQKSIVEQYMEGFRHTDYSMILDCLTEDVIWEMPGFFRHEGIRAFEGEIENPDADGHPKISVSRLIEEGNIVVAEGTVHARLKGAPAINAVFSDVFYFRDGKICKLVTYLMTVENL